MRKVFIVGLFVIQMLLVACSSGDEVVGNPLLGIWEMESRQDQKTGEVVLPKEGEHGYVLFFPDKMVMDEPGGKETTMTVLGYAVEDGRVEVTIEGVRRKKGEQIIIQFQLLENDRIKWEIDDVEETMILRRVGAASSG